MARANVLRPLFLSEVHACHYIHGEVVIIFHNNDTIYNPSPNHFTVLGFKPYISVSFSDSSNLANEDNTNQYINVWVYISFSLKKKKK